MKLTEKEICALKEEAEKQLKSNWMFGTFRARDVLKLLEELDEKKKQIAANPKGTHE